MRCIFHDWYILEVKYETEFNGVPVKRLEKREFVSRFSVLPAGKPYYKRVCLRCGRIDDQIEDKINKIIQEYEREDQRKCRAMAMLNKKNCV